MNNRKSDDEQQVTEVAGLQSGTLSMKRALGLTIVVFSPVLTAATVGPLVASSSGSSGWLSVLAGAIMIACIGVCIVPFAKKYVVSGALYSYIGHVFGDTAKLISGASLAVGYLVGMMAVLGALGLYAGSLLSSTFGFAAATELPVQSVIYIVVVLAAAALAYRGLDTSARLSILLLFASSPIVTIVLISNVFSTDFDFAGQFTFSDFSFSGFTAGMVLSATFLVGFEASGATAAETADPLRSIPRIITVVPLIVGGFAVVATLLSVPTMSSISGAVATGESPLAAMAENSGLGWLSGVADLSLVLTCFAVVVGYMNYTTRVWATMAADGALPSYLGKVSKRTHTPVGSIIVLSILAVAFPLLISATSGGTTLEVYTYIATLFPYFWVVPYVLICIGAVILLRKSHNLNLTIVVSAFLGGLGIAWVYVNSFLNPSGTPVDYMTWVAPVAIGVTAIGMLFGKHRTTRQATATSSQSATHSSN